MTFHHSIRLLPQLALLAMLPIPAIAQLTAPPAPTSAPAHIHITVPEVVGADVIAARRRVNAGDASVVPTLLLWLSSEQDGLGIGNASPRLRTAFEGTIRFRVVEAIPWLISVYDDPSASLDVKANAGFAVMRIDPQYSREFLHELTDALQPWKGKLNPRFAAAVVLLELGDTQQRAFLLQHLKGVLDGLDRSPPVQGSEAAALLTALMTVSDHALADSFVVLKDGYGPRVDREYLKPLIRQMRTNELSQDRWLELAASEPPPDDVEGKDLRACAIRALQHHGDKAALARVDAMIKVWGPRARGPRVVRAVAATAPATSPGTSPATTMPAIDLRVEEWKQARAVLQGCVDADEGIRIRSRLPGAPPSPLLAAPATSPSTAAVAVASSVSLPAGAAAPEEGEEVQQVVAIFPPHVNGSPETGWIAELWPLTDSPDVTTRARFTDPALIAAALRQMPGTLALVKVSADRASLLGIRPLEAQPGEASTDGYIFSGTREIEEEPERHSAVVLRKFGRDLTALIPNRTTPEGQSVPDHIIAQQVQQLREGQVVEAHLDTASGATMLSFIAPYRPALRAQFIRLTEVAIAGDAARPAVELMIGRKPVTYLLPEGPGEDTPRPVLEPIMLQALLPGYAMKIVPGQTVGGVPGMRDIRLRGAVAKIGAGVRTYVSAGRLHFWASSIAHAGKVEASALVRPDTHAASVLGQAILRLTGPETAGLSPEKIESLHKLSVPLTTLGEADVAGVHDLLLQYNNAPDAFHRQTIEQEMYLVLQRISVRETANDAARLSLVKALLDDAEYARLVELGWQERTSVAPASTQPIRKD